MPHDLQKRESYPPFFQAVLTPHRSLSRRGMNIVLWCTGSIAGFYSLLLVLMGLWPAPILLAMPVLFLWLAFRHNFATAETYEEVSVSPLEVRLKQVTYKGEVQEYVLNPFHMKLHIEKDDDIGVTRILIRSEQLFLVIGAFLNPDDRTSFATAFSQAVHSAKNRGLDLV
ncbi:hypothetical protein PsAD2_01552 [Pseudovibrio axinellae]|uniref:Integral membrane protein n=1 Tax=Pseudovibrio axinellae TaxID=989403 RepID=A0A165ZMP1_9HYPH|nr:DUF2244 domain-containing protein [Pseudovibrio axinellae]KZL20066.1 hypothetical protein PsAD2_01552 [Pseudovibrio axinellae]SEQ26874.1 Uncharacterized membrane protein [Pseudovibrio axinellae]